MTVNLHPIIFATDFNHNTKQRELESVVGIEVRKALIWFLKQYGRFRNRDHRACPNLADYRPTRRIKKNELSHC